MPAHDWTRVKAGIFHHFHQRWMSALSDCLNAGRLPPGYYALAEQTTGGIGPDVLALQIDTSNGMPTTDTVAAEDEGGGGTAVTVAEPKVRFTAQTEMDYYVAKQNTLVIRHSGGDRVVALIEIVSPGNKSSRHALRTFVEKLARALYGGYHLLILDLHPPGPRDPNGIHGAIWEEIADDSFRLPADKPLTLAAYCSDMAKRAYVEPLAVGEPLLDMPLFLRPGAHVPVPLEETYNVAWQNVPQRWRNVLAPPHGQSLA